MVLRFKWNRKTSPSLCPLASGKADYFVRFLAAARASARSWASASSQSSSELPGQPIFCLRSAMKYARSEISSVERVIAGSLAFAGAVFLEAVFLAAGFLAAGLDFATGALLTVLIGAAGVFVAVVFFAFGLPASAFGSVAGLEALELRGAEVVSFLDFLGMIITRLSSIGFGQAASWEKFAGFAIAFS